MRKFFAWVGGLLVLLLLVLGSAIVFGTTEPPPVLASVVNSAVAIDRTGMPGVSQFKARDGSLLSYRHYPSTGPRAALLVHGSADSSLGMHAVARALSEAGVSAYAIDMRGHGKSLPLGDIGYVGQLEHDVEDMVTHIRLNHPTDPISLIGHSSGGGFVVRLMGSDLHKLFDNFVVTAPFLGVYAPTSRGVDGGGWVKASVPRILALTALQPLNVDALNALPVLHFAVPPNAPVTPSYSYRLMRNFGPNRNFVDDVRRNGREMSVIAGQADEVFLSERYADAFAPVSPMVHVKLLPDLNHMGIVSKPAALKAIVDAVVGTPPPFNPVAGL